MAESLSRQPAAGPPESPGGLYHGWWILAASVVAMALGSGVSFWSFGLYVSPLERDFGWSRAEVSAGFSVALLVSGLSGPLVGLWIDRRGIRSAVVAGAALTAASYLLLAATRDLWQWYLFSSINALCRQLMFFIPFQTLVSRWFDRRRGVALSILGIGFSLGGFVVVPLMRWIIDSAGWEGSFLFAAAAIAAVYLPIGLFVVRESPAAMGLTPDGADASGDGESPAGRGDGPDVTLGEAVRTPVFWAIAGALTLFFFALFGWLVHQVPFFEANGLSRGTAAALVSGSAAAGILARLGVGLAADRVTRLESAAIALVGILIVALVVLIVRSDLTGILVFLALWTVGTAGIPLMEGLLLSRTFGMGSFASILGAIIVVETAGQIVSPTVAGVIYDATGSYDGALVMFAVAMAGSLTLLGVARRLGRPVRG
jgi:sugar phosphate permease